MSVLKRLHVGSFSCPAVALVAHTLGLSLPSVHVSRADPGFGVRAGRTTSGKPLTWMKTVLCVNSVCFPPKSVGNTPSETQVLLGHGSILGPAWNPEQTLLEFSSVVKCPRAQVADIRASFWEVT